jgi:hypothetical protein
VSSNNEISGVEILLALAAAALAVWGWRKREQIAGTLLEAMRQAQQSSTGDQSDVIHDALPAPLLLPAHTVKKGSK